MQYECQYIKYVKSSAMNRNLVKMPPMQVITSTEHTQRQLYTKELCNLGFKSFALETTHFKISLAVKCDKQVLRTRAEEDLS